MEQDDITTDQSQTTPDHGHEPNGCAAARGRQGEPLFRRYAVPKEWRTKDGAVA
jgi:hypothetical protein